MTGVQTCALPIYEKNGVIICLYVDDMLIFGTDLKQVEITKAFLSSSFDMKDMGEQMSSLELEF